MNKEILDGNKLIVEFMEIKPTELKGIYSVSQHNYTCLGNTPEMALSGFVSIAKYHESWDWLMPVLEKIEAKGRRWEIGISPYSTSHHYCKIWSIGTIERVSLLDAVYSAVLEFIKWYNSNKQTNDNARINR